MASSAQVLVGADVRVMDERDTRAEAVAWRGGELVAIGDRQSVLLAAGDGAEILDLGGATVLPGFIDAHQHPSIVALYGGRVRLVPPRVTDLASFLTAIAEVAQATPKGAWIVAVDWDDLRLRERRPPTRAELDDAAPDHPLMAMHYGCHHALANSRALALAGIDRHTPDPSGGRIARGARGEPSGLLVERALCRVERLARASLLASDAPGFLARIRAHHDALLEHGITRVVDATVPLDVIALYREASRSGALRVPTVAMPVSVGGYLEAPWDALDGPVTGEDDGVLSIGPLKLVLDGAPECSMCLSVWQTVGTLAGACALAVASGSLDPVRTVMSARPRLGAGGKLRTGISMYAREDASAIVRAATERGFAIATHAVGNDATDTAMAAYAAAGPALGRGGRPRIEHALFVDRALAQRIGDLGVGVVTQPAFLGLPTFATGPSIVGLGTIPLRMLLDAGVTVAGSSDYPVATFDPLAGVRAAVTRRTPGGREHEPEQRVSLHEALTMYTRSAAELSGCLDCAGTLAPGKRADLVVLDRALDAASLGAARVRATVIGGDLAFGSPTAP